MMGANRNLLVWGAVAIATCGCSLKPKTMNNSSQNQLAPLEIRSISPTAASTLGGTTLTLTGSGFDAGTTVKLGTADCMNVRVSNSTTLRCVLPRHDAGAVTLTVRTSDGR